MTNLLEPPTEAGVCGFIPPTPGYAGCTRRKGHSGPCAHALVVAPAEEQPERHIKNVLCVRIRNAEGRCLMLLSRELQAWTLPGGKMEVGETWEAAASRELLEETGLTCKHFRQVGWMDYISPAGQQFVVMFVDALHTTGDADIIEPAKHMGMAWLDISDQGLHRGYPLFKNFNIFMEQQRVA